MIILIYLSIGCVRFIMYIACLSVCLCMGLWEN